MHQITVYHTEDDENYTVQYYDKVYFRHNKKTNLIDKGLEKGSTGSITIPTTEELNISTDDYVVEGLLGTVSDINKMQVKEVNKLAVNNFNNQNLKLRISKIKCNKTNKRIKKFLKKKT